MGEDYDLEDETDHIEQNLLGLEATMSCHRIAFLPYSYTRLPCAAHKVGLESLETPLYFYLFNQVHLVVDKSASDKFLMFGQTLTKARCFIVKYRKSSKAKEVLRQWFPKRLPGYVVTCWSKLLWFIFRLNICYSGGQMFKC